MFNLNCSFMLLMIEKKASNGVIEGSSECFVVTSQLTPQSKPCQVVVKNLSDVLQHVQKCFDADGEKYLSSACAYE